MFNKNIMSLLSANLISKLLVYSGQLLVAFWLTPSELGELKTELSYIEISVVLTTLGFNSSLLYSLPKSDIPGRLIETSVFFTFFVSTLFTVVLYFSNIFLFNKDQLNTILGLLVISIPFLTLISIYSSVYQATQQFGLYSRLTVISKLISALIIVILTYAIGLNGYVLAYILGIILTLALLINNLKFKLNKLISLEIVRELFHVGKFSLLSNLIGIISIYLGLFALNLIVSDKNIVGYYSFSLMILLGFEVLTQSIQQYKLPILSSIYGHKSFRNDLKSTEKSYIKFTLLISILSILIVSFLEIIFTDFAYVESFGYLKVMILGWFISGFYSLKGIAFIASGKTIENFRVSIANLILITITTFLLGHYYGVYGVILARVITVSLLAIYVNYRFKYI